VFKETKVHKAQLAIKVRKAQKVTPEPVYKVHRAQLAIKVHRAQKVQLEFKALLAHQA
jgi:hypothetical protein